MNFKETLERASEYVKDTQNNPSEIVTRAKNLEEYLEKP